MNIFEIKKGFGEQTLVRNYYWWYLSAGIRWCDLAHWPLFKKWQLSLCPAISNNLPFTGCLMFYQQPSASAVWGHPLPPSKWSWILKTRIEPKGNATLKTSYCSIPPIAFPITFLDTQFIVKVIGLFSPLLGSSVFGDTNRLSAGLIKAISWLPHFGGF